MSKSSLLQSRITQVAPPCTSSPWPNPLHGVCERMDIRKYTCKCYLLMNKPCSQTIMYHIFTSIWNCIPHYFHKNSSWVIHSWALLGGFFFMGSARVQTHNLSFTHSMLFSNAILVGQMSAVENNLAADVVSRSKNVLKSFLIGLFAQKIMHMFVQRSGLSKCQILT